MKNNHLMIPLSLVALVSITNMKTGLAQEVSAQRPVSSSQDKPLPTAEAKTKTGTAVDKVKISQMPQGAPGMPAYVNQSGQPPQDPFYSQYVQQTPPPIMPNGQVLVSTTDGIAGYRVVGYKGIVRGDVVFGPTILQAFKSSLKAIIGGKIGGYTQMCQRARQNAFEDMLNQARQLGANAIVGVSYDSSTFSTTNDNDVGTEVFCYGTAVTVAPQ